MRIRITRATVATGRLVTPGEVLDVSEADGALLVSLRRAVATDAAPETAQAKRAEVATTVAAAREMIGTRRRT